MVLSVITYFLVEVLSGKIGSKPANCLERLKISGNDPWRVRIRIRPEGKKSIDGKWHFLINYSRVVTYCQKGFSHRQNWTKSFKIVDLMVVRQYIYNISKIDNFLIKYSWRMTCCQKDVFQSQKCTKSHKMTKSTTLNRVRKYFFQIDSFLIKNLWLNDISKLRLSWMINSMYINTWWIFSFPMLIKPLLPMLKEHK